MGIFYDGTKLLSLMDKNGNKPELYLSTSNRSAGKTTYYNRLATNRFLKNGSKFMLIYRYKYELCDIADKFFKEIKNLFFNDYIMYSTPKAKGIYHELFIYNENDGEKSAKSCGYAVALNSANTLKNLSHFFSDTELMIFDEFQSETNNYCSNEISKFISLHTSVARGGGSHVRYVPVIMISNAVSLINPYFCELGISDKLNTNTKFLRGDGFVLEQGFNKNASNLQSQSAFNRAFSNNSYVAYSAQNVYLNDNQNFIEKITGKSKYLCTVKFNGCNYAIRQYDEMGIVYCDDKFDKSFKYKIAVTTDDHNTNYVMLKSNEFFISTLRFYFERGAFRFKNLQCKQCILKLLSF